MTFTLRHIKSDKTYNEPRQDWEMTSDMAFRDYSGTYTFKMIPCVVENVRTVLRNFHNSNKINGLFYFLSIVNTTRFGYIQ